ncbi:50S ribosomal protein L3 N(5)-glutamine methyltransferase [Solemya elarraichensis gill symbiont]|uniref:Ribosomal protein L3 N(5)-glutamine methyltransferase n=1 Tax=Solemya elarraichensis gill symbiont TaxID=1918949 RepID=A0A1T2LA55_9GAMM|nr:50S ribosomal protein L3 N(5)-glutamine methyltransferase [Solemya elarraichensis gill symbiont]OOZ41989.1 ribosomal protein L3 N(5)-glutamine methyltransferase [Solemya elarraichensis gill symbiont]
MTATTSDPQQQLQTLRDWVRWGASLFMAKGIFYGHGTDNALDESLALVLHAVGLDHTLPEPFLDTRVTTAEAQKVETLLQRRVDERVPLAYLIGQALFAGYNFIVTPDVLVPRSPIAELILDAFQPWVDPDSLEHVLDLCTGSGCIGIATALQLPDTEVDLADISPAALKIAKQNIERHWLGERVRAVESDLFDGLGGKQYNLIVSNPPYVSSDEYAALPGEYHSEPKLGLEAGADGLDIVRRILSQAHDHLLPGGVLIVEVGSATGALVEAFPELPFVWLEFEYGGDGVFLLNKADLADFG